MKKILFTIIAVLLLAPSAGAVKMKDLKIYINPGHGGYTSNDRPIRIYPFEANDSMGYWESKSNLYKGLHLYHILDSLGTKAMLSRIKNTEDDDRGLSDISREANDFGADLFFSIHSNAGESVNYPLMLYRENAVGVPRYPENVTLSDILWKNLHSSKLPVWTRDTPYVSGDLTFYPQWGTSGLGVLRNLYVIGLLSEGGMHEHRPEAHRLMNDDVWWLEAWHFVKTIMEYYNTEDRFVTGNVAGIIYDNHNLRERIMPAKFTMHGRDKKAPVNGAYVELKDMNGNLVQKRNTDDMYNGAFVFRNITPGDYKLIVSHDDFYTYETSVTVTANEVTYNDVPLDLKRESPLEVVSYTPNPAQGELVSCVEPVVFKFNYDVDEASFEKAFKIEPAVEGEIIYSESYSTVTFKPTVAFEPDVTYTVTLSTDVKHPDPNFATPNLPETLIYSFTTQNRNRLEIIKTFPEENGKVHYKSPSLEFRFDKTLNAVSIYDLVTVYDKSNNKMPINARSSSSNKLSGGFGNVNLVLNGNLVEGEPYKVVLQSTIKDKEGVPLGEDVVINFEADNQGTEKEGTVIEDFEGAAIFDYNAENSTGLKSDPGYFVNTSKVLFGKSSGRFTYSFASHKDGIAVWDYKGGMKIVNNGDVVGLHVFGDLNDHELWVGFTAGTDTKYEKVTNIDFLGWHYFEIHLSTLEPGVEYLLSNIKLVQKEALYAQQGAFQLDDMLVNSSEGSVNEIVIENLQVYPTVASDIIYVRGDAEISSLELFSVSGTKVKVSNKTEIKVSDLSDGMYFLKINSDKGSVVKSVIVKK